MNAYVTTHITKKFWTVLGNEWGADYSEKSTIIVLYMVWWVLEQFSASTWLTVLDTWGTIRSQVNRTYGSSPKLTLTEIATNTTTLCYMLTTSSSFTTMLWPCLTRLKSTLNWILTRSVIPACILDPSCVNTGSTMECMHGLWDLPSMLERLLITVWKFWEKHLRGSIRHPSKPQNLLCMIMSLILTSQSHLTLNETLTSSSRLE